MDIGRVLTELRERAHLTQGEVADKVDVAPGTVSRHETNARRPRRAMLSRYAEAYGVTVETLLERAHQYADQAEGEPRKRVVKNKSDLACWARALASASLDTDVKVVLLELMAVADEDVFTVATSPKMLSEQLPSETRENVIDVWSDVLESGFVETINDQRYSVKLIVPPEKT